MIPDDAPAENPTRSAGLCVPDVAGLSLMDAALAYAEAGWYVLPTDPGDVKNPGSVVGGKWHELSSRDPDTIRRWWADSPNYGIALHCGRSGALVFDLDANSVDMIRVYGRGDIADALARAGAVQGTRREGDRGHYIFAMPPDKQFGNGAGTFTVWGEVRGKNGVIIAAPTPHPNAETKGGCYSQRKTGSVGPLPEVLRECLTEAAESADPLTDAELDLFLDTYTGGGCGRGGCRHTVDGPADWFKAAVAEGASRHEKITAALPWAMSEAMAGCYSAREAFGTLHSTYSATFDAEAEPARVAQLGGEYTRIVKWAAANANPERAHRNDELPTDTEMEAFWTSCAELSDLRQFARARRVGPWSMFGVCAALVVSSVPPYVVLPPLVGHYASLNLFVALVGKSGSIKSAAIGAALDWLGVDPPPNPKKPGSGEGLAKCFAYVKKPKGEPAMQVGKNWSVLAEIPEVDTLTATGGRGGSTLMSELRYAWSGERLGIDYAADDKAIVLQSQRYRLCMIVGVQPLRAAPIFDDADAGTPQRFVWFPVSDPNRPTQRPDEPAKLGLPAWVQAETDASIADDASEGVFRIDPNVALACRMNVPADPDGFEVMAVPDAVNTAIDEQAFAVLGDADDIDPLDGHKLLCQEKLAAAIAVLRQHKEITEHDWELAGTAMKVSDRTRAEVLETLAAEAGERNRKAGQASGIRKIAEAERIAAERAKKVARIAEKVIEKLRSKNDQTLNEIKKQFSGPDKQYVNEALGDLEDDGQITKQPFVYRGNEGFRIHVNNEDES
ncbi:hypothetical protein MSP7336_03361 [Mycobacterium shimoidei]|uniref:DNA primase/polymerase bifunctional N-terminal domain-containing protein n=1 Tax=Mycobacterium shimoidei TaxID=29313 RepID=A0A375Z1Z3_MYCSH|nr:bifunctional DNA primase/polymerase [Mycobacterium shimoidei]SRX95097.1 hypothetical protein MSP7336_03361 [Mycobacterium shimoidei]